MEPIKDTINISVRNNTNLPQTISILGGNQDPNGTPANTLAQWNIASETFFASDWITIQAAPASNPTLVNYEVQLQSATIQGVVAAINTLGIGVFQYSGSTIYTANNLFVYGDLYIEARNTFISTWNTSLTSGGSSNANQVSLPLLPGGTYNFVVSWGDGTFDTITSWNQPEATHTYATPGIYTIQTTGQFEGIGFGVSNDNLKLLNILSWGKIRLTSPGSQFFSGCTNLDLSQVSNVPDLSATTNLNNAFSNCTNITTIGRINEWNVSGITQLQSTFLNSNFNDDISSWNTSSLLDMLNTFKNCPFNGQINSWDVSNVTLMFGAFQNNTQFNQPLDLWNVSGCTDMGYMFDGASSFNQPINSWDVSNVQSMAYMFNSATAFNQDISGWNIVNVQQIQEFMGNKTYLDYSATLLDAIYNSWSTLPLTIPNVTSFGTIKYTAAGQAGKNILTGTYGWTITDGGI